MDRFRRSLMHSTSTFTGIRLVVADDESMLRCATVEPAWAEGAEGGPVRLGIIVSAPRERPGQRDRGSAELSARSRVQWLQATLGRITGICGEPVGLLDIDVAPDDPALDAVRDSVDAPRLLVTDRAR